MISLNKFLTLTLVCLVLTSLLILSTIPVKVQAAPKPSVPQFTVRILEESHTIEVTIKNQPFTSYTTVENGFPYNDLYYTVQVKVLGEDWKTLKSSVNQSDSQYTIVTDSAQRYVAGSQLDFRVQAAAGYAEGLIGQAEGVFRVYLDPDGMSDWSKIQTITFPGNSPPGPPSQTVTQPENPPASPDNNQPQTLDFVFNPLFLLGISVLFVGIVAVAVLIFTKHYTIPQTSSKQQIHQATV